MRQIIKRVEPTSLTQHRNTPIADYENYTDKATLRQNLVAEQRGLCCYCMTRIQPAADKMKIEHWHCQENYEGEQLDYSNILGACMGGEGQSYKRQHCDTRKGCRDLSRNPSNPMHHVEGMIHYLADGTIRSNDAQFNADLNDVLNLNDSFLKRNRVAVLDSFKMSLNKRGPLQRATLERWLALWDGSTNQDELNPYNQVVVYWLRKRLNRV